MTDSVRANEETLAAYEQAAAIYAERMSPRPDPSVLEFIDRFVTLLAGPRTVLEVGSGTGRDADLLEARGATVARTDAATAFVAALRRAGHSAQRLNVLRDDLGGPYDGIYANAVFLHIPRDLLPGVLRKAHAAVRLDGILGFTMKAGIGDSWSTEKLGLPRFVARWTIEELEQVIEWSPWRTVELSGMTGPTSDWLQVLCRAS